MLTALPGDYGKPRPAVVVQSDWLNQSDCSSIVVCPMTSFEAIVPDSGSGWRPLRRMA
ncbi:MAG: type II toxin-antitoxin system PemK/MazF family toxin [Geminicoccaceae bacterium]